MTVDINKQRNKKRVPSAYVTFNNDRQLVRNLKGFEIIKFYRAHSELLREFYATNAGRDYALFIEKFISHDLHILATRTDEAVDISLLAKKEIKAQLAVLVQHPSFYSCTHLYEELTVCLNALEASGPSSLVNKAIFDVLSVILTKIFQAKK